MRNRILLVDDDLGFRTLIRRILDSHPFHICGEATDGKEAIQKVLQLRPDIVLLDINMPVLDGIAAAHEIRHLSPETKIIFLTSHEVVAFRDAAQELGHGFLLKIQASEELIPLLNGFAEVPPNTAKPLAKSHRATSAAKILIADDQEFVRRTIRSMLSEQSDWKIYEAENGKLQLTKCPKFDPMWLCWISSCPK